MRVRHAAVHATGNDGKGGERWKTMRGSKGSRVGREMGDNVDENQPIHTATGVQLITDTSRIQA